METAKNIDSSHLVRHRDATTLLQNALARYQARPMPEVIVEVGSNTGKSTMEIATKFPKALVIGVESDSTLCQFARENYSVNRSAANVVFVTASISGREFWSQLSKQVTSLKKNSVDLVLSTHYLRMSDPSFEIALDNIAQMLKPGGMLIASISMWSDLFDIEKRVALQKFPEILTKSQRASNLITLVKPNREEERVQLTEFLTKRGFGASPEIIHVYCHIKFKKLKMVQDCIQWMCPIGSCMPDTSRLQFYHLFFEEVYEDYFGNRNSVHAFEYEYTTVACHKTGK